MYVNLPFFFLSSRIADLHSPAKDQSVYRKWIKETHHTHARTLESIEIQMPILFIRVYTEK